MDLDYDLIVIGSGPAGQKAAVQGAKLRKRVAMIERRHMVGGVCVNTGTIPSKTLREAVVYLTGMSLREVYGASYRVKSDITIADLDQRTHHVIAREVDVIRDQLLRNHVDLVFGTARFVDANTLGLQLDSGDERQVSAERIVVAVGTKPTRPAGVEFDDVTVIDSDGLLGMKRTKVTVVEKHSGMLDFCDDEIIEGLRHQLRERGLVFRFGETVTGVELHGGASVTHLQSGKRIAADAVFYSAGRQGATDTLCLDRAGLEADARGRISVDDHYRTAVPHIYAVGDVIGFPSLAATSMEQGRLAARHAFGEASNEMSTLLPIGIYTIPEISFVGRTEEELTAEGIPYEIGISRYRELARGQILSDMHGMLKLLVSAEDRRLLGVHALGTGATELIHIGQAVMAFDGTIDYLIETVFNYPTLAEGYKVAALDASNKIAALARLDGNTIGRAV